MARWIFLIMPPTYRLESIGEAFSQLPDFSVRGPSEGALLIHTRFDAIDDSFFASEKSNERVQLEQFSLSSLVEDYEEVPACLSGLVEASVFFVKWRSDDFLRRMLESLSSDPRIFIDNEHGLVLPIQEFLEWWQANPQARLG